MDQGWVAGVGHSKQRGSRRRPRHGLQGTCQPQSQEEGSQGPSYQMARSGEPGTPCWAWRHGWSWGLACDYGGGTQPCEPQSPPELYRQPLPRGALLTWWLCRGRAIRDAVGNRGQLGTVSQTDRAQNPERRRTCVDGRGVASLGQPRLGAPGKLAPHLPSCWSLLSAKAKGVKVRGGLLAERLSRAGHLGGRGRVPARRPSRLLLNAPHSSCAGLGPP